MAEIDFSNATVSVIGTSNVIDTSYVILNTCNLYDVTGLNKYSNNFSRQVITATPKYSAIFYGTMARNGTEFYIYVQATNGNGETNRGYKISNISFQTGDTFNFIVSAEIET